MNGSDVAPYLLPFDWAQDRSLGVSIWADQRFFGVSQQWFNAIQLAGVSQRPGLGDTESGPGTRQLVGQGIQPPRHGRQFAMVDHSQGIPRNQMLDPLDIPSQQRIPHSFDDLPFALIPYARAAVQGRNLVGLGLLKPATEQISEELMIAIPMPLIVQRDQEQIGLFQVG